MTAGIRLEITWFDEGVIELRFTCSNGQFSGSAALYTRYEELANLAEALRGFPTGRVDKRQIALGVFNPEHANGGVLMDFYCLDSGGHAFVEVRLRADGCKAFGDVESVATRIPIEAAAVDALLAELKRMPISIGASAVLPMAL